MEMTFFIGVLVIASFISGVMTVLLKKGLGSIALSILAPIAALIVYALMTRDEFGVWAMILSLSVCASVMGSIFGIFVVRQIHKKEVVQSGAKLILLFCLFSMSASSFAEVTLLKDYPFPPEKIQLLEIGLQEAG